MSTELGSPEHLAEHLAWLRSLGSRECTCPHAYKGLGRMYGQDQGKGWVRLETVPGCPEHDPC